MDELESAEQIGRDRDLAPTLGAALQGPVQLQRIPMGTKGVPDGYAPRAG